MKSLKFIFVFIFMLVCFSFASAYQSADYVNYQPQADFQTYYSSSNINTYWPILGDKEECRARQDILLSIAPGGCQPMVVRSDLLADQPVPVFCQIDALQINPLIDIKQIKNIRFSGNYPKEVADAGFHPARAALDTRDALLGSPLINNIGYVVVILKRNPVESSLPKFVNVTLSAQLEYDAGNAIGIGRTEFLLSVPNSKTAEISKIKNSFWNGRYSLKLDEIDPNFAVVSVYDGDVKISTQKVDRGKTSGEVYMPGSYCTVALQISYDGMESATERARIEVTNDLGTDSFDVYKGSSFLNGRCTVSKIEIQPGGKTGNITATCDGKSFLLEKKSVIKKDLEVITKDNQEGVVKSISGEKAMVLIGDKEVEINFTDLKPKMLVDVPLGTEADDAFGKVIEGYEQVAKDFKGEKSNPEGASTIQKYGTYGEEALVKAIALADRYGKYATKERLLTEIIEFYPDSTSSENYRTELSKLYSIDVQSSGAIVNANGRANVIRLNELTAPSKIANATFAVDNNLVPMTLEETKTSLNSGSVQIRLNKIYAGEANVDILCPAAVGSTDFKKEGTYTLKLNEGKEVCSGRIVKLTDVQLDQVARIKVLPTSKGTGTETNLTVTIGIEKSAIKLSPAKTKEMIKNLNASIAKWEKISERLGKVVTGLKATCFATSAVLTVKSFMSGVSGQTLARQQAMSGPDGWKIKCQSAINNGWIDRNGNGIRDGDESVSYRTPTECFNAEAKNINGDITAITNALQNVNKGIAGVENKPGVTSGSLISGKNVNEQEARKQYLAYLKGIYPNDKAIQDLKINDTDGTAPFSYEDLRQMAFDREILKSNQEGLKSTANKKETSLQETINTRTNIYATSKSQEAIIGVIPTPVGLVVAQPKPANGQVLDLKSETDKKTLGGKTLELSGISLPTEANSAMYITGAYEKVNEDNIKTGTFQENSLLVVGRKDGTKLIPLEVYGYTTSGADITLTPITDPKINVNNFQSTYSISEFVDSGGGLEKGKIADSDRKVRYFETGPDKGLVSYVPLWPDDGFYVRVDSTLKVGNNIAAYDSSGLPKAWNICNTGKNGIVELSADKCYFYTTGNPIVRILDQDAATSTKLFEDSRKAIMQANNKANNQNVEIVLDKKYTYSKGAPISAFAGTECQEFMSVSDCKWLFNVCDPVICPATRCNLGGKWPVSDVIQTGIVGSALLCLPNYREGIIMPVCLSGIQAGIDGWVSVLKAHRDCLQENLNTGRMIGICEQMYSIYSCDFFWRQVGPVANILIPKLIESVYTGSQGARAGGEYLTVQTAWDNTQKSIDYVTQSYAVNAFKAFQARSVEEIGSEVCKGYISAKGPTALKSLLESESPPQFHAWFSTIAYSSATVPATAQYKVFYHIYAGKNAGSYYNVYLKNPPNSPYYSQASTIQVASGFVGQDQTASETRDFTAPEGYQELCVRINNEEKCGFKEVSTSYAINALRDSYAKEQIDQKSIKSQSECISGSASVGALLANTNPQAALEEAALPTISNRGIVRICSATNPGGSVDPTGAWQDVGYCDNENMRCWLSQKSVDDAITANNLGLKNATATEIMNNLNNGASGKYFVDTSGVKEIKEVRELVGRIKDGDATSADTVITRIDSVLPNFVMNSQKAALLLIKAIALEKKYKTVLDSAKGIEKVALPVQPGLGEINSGLISLIKNMNESEYGILKFIGEYFSMTDVNLLNSEQKDNSISKYINNSANQEEKYLLQVDQFISQIKNELPSSLLLSDLNNFRSKLDSGINVLKSARDNIALNAKDAQLSPGDPKTLTLTRTELKKVNDTLVSLNDLKGALLKKLQQTQIAIPSTNNQQLVGQTKSETGLSLSTAYISSSTVPNYIKRDGAVVTAPFKYYVIGPIINKQVSPDGPSSNDQKVGSVEVDRKIKSFDTTKDLGSNINGATIDVNGKIILQPKPAAVKTTWTLNIMNKDSFQGNCDELQLQVYISEGEKGAYTFRLGTEQAGGYVGQPVTLVVNSVPFRSETMYYSQEMLGIPSGLRAWKGTSSISGNLQFPDNRMTNTPPASFSFVVSSVVFPVAVGGGSLGDTCKIEEFLSVTN